MAENQEKRQVLTSEQERTELEAAHKVALPAKRLVVWDILNSQLMLWILGSVVLSGITYYWNHRNDERAEAARKQDENNAKAAREQQQQIDRQREDSQFLGTMLPYLTNPDPNVRLRAVDVITARYPNGQVPRQVYLLLAKVIGTESALPSSRQTEEQKSLLASAARTLDKQTPTDADAAAAVQQLPPRVYFQIFDEAQRPEAKEIQAQLQKDGLLVPGIENVASKTRPLKETEVRYFDHSDKPTAERVRETLVRIGFSPRPVQKPKTTTKVNPGTIEVWFGSAS